MKNILLLRKPKGLLFLGFAFLFLLSFVDVRGQSLPQYDGLNYTAGVGLQTQTGWTTLNSGDDLLIASGSLSYIGLESSTGNKVTFAGEFVSFWLA